MNVKMAFLAVLWLSMGGDLVRADSPQNWPRWRGPEDNGSIEGASYPVHFDPEHVLWKVELPGRGCSTPVVWNNRIYVTAPMNGLDSLIALDESGHR
jgi:hypothetical protein